jgi:hypothetical protein
MDMTTHTDITEKAEFKEVDNLIDQGKYEYEAALNALQSIIVEQMLKLDILNDKP